MTLGSGSLSLTPTFIIEPLFLILGLYVDISSKSQPNNTTNTSENMQNVHIGYLLESDSREAAIFAFLSALAGSQATVFLTVPPSAAERSQAGGKPEQRDLHTA